MAAPDVQGRGVGGRERRGGIGAGDALAQGSAGAPAEGGEAAHVEQLPRRPVGLAAVVDDAAAEADDLHHRLGQLGDRDVGADTDVDQRRRLVAALHQEHAGIGEVVDVEELAPRRAAAPDDQLVVAALAFASCALRISAGSTWLVARS